VLSIVYVSAANHTMSDEDIASILIQARANNVRHELTGALLYYNGRFIQVLEGPDERVAGVYATIAADPRHRSVHKMSEKFIAQRQFPEWTMGFRPLSDNSIRQLTGFNDFFDVRTGKERLRHADNEAQQFLEWLAEYWLAPL
jgi:hypothetical protein